MFIPTAGLFSGEVTRSNAIEAFQKGINVPGRGVDFGLPLAEIACSDIFGHCPFVRLDMSVSRRLLSLRCQTNPGFWFRSKACDQAVFVFPCRYNIGTLLIFA